MFGKKNNSQKIKETKDAKKKKIETSKVVLLVVFIMCLEILIYTQIVTILFRDSAALYSLIGVPVTLVPVVLGYYWKAKAQNTKGGITYDMAMKENNEEELDSDKEGNEGISEGQG